MAEAIAIIGLLSALGSLIDLGRKSIVRLHEFHSNSNSTSALFQDVSNQFPLLLDIVTHLSNRLRTDPLSDSTEQALASAVDGCIRQISEINRRIEKWAPTPKDSGVKRACKAFGSIRNEKKIMEALRILETYKTTLSMYLTTSTRSKSPRCLDQIYYLPHPQISHFVGREEILEQLSSSFQGNTMISLPRRLVVVLVGMGGQGKTQIALEYCRRSQALSTFSAIFWADATSENALIRSYANIAGVLSKSGVSFPDDNSRVTYVQEYFRKLQQRWLIIFDNFDRPDLFQSLDKYFPPGILGTFLITSRHTGSERLGTAITVSAMTKDESTVLLLQRAKQETTEENVAQATLIARRLGHYPLAIDQAGSYISSRKLPLDSFIEYFAARKDVILQYTPALWEYRKTQSGNNETSIGAFTTFEMSLEHAADGEERAAIAHFLTLSAFLNSTNLHEGLFRCYFEIQEQEHIPEWMSYFLTDSKWNKYRFQDMVVSLNTLSLVQDLDFGRNETRFSLHPVIKDWLRLRMPSDAPRDCTLEYVREAIQLCTSAIDFYTKVQSLESRRSLVSLIDGCLENNREFSEHDLYSMGDSVVAFASTYNAHGRYADAIVLYTSLLEKENRENSPHASRTAMNLANALRNHGKYDEAEVMYENILGERTSKLGLINEDTLRALEGLATIYNLQQRFVEADRTYQRIVASREGLLESSNEEIARALEGLADVRRHRSYIMQAEALYAKALQVRITDPAYRHYDTLGCVEGLAIVYRRQHRLQESISLYRQVLESLEIVYGTFHPRYLRTALNLSIAYGFQGKSAEAIALARLAYQNLSDMLGPLHMDTIRAEVQIAQIDSLSNSAIDQPQAGQQHELEERRRSNEQIDGSSSNAIYQPQAVQQQQQQQCQELEERRRSNKQINSSSSNAIYQPQAAQQQQCHELEERRRSNEQIDASSSNPIHQQWALCTPQRPPAFELEEMHRTSVASRSSYFKVLNSFEDLGLDISKGLEPSHLTEITDIEGWERPEATVAKPECLKRSFNYQEAHDSPWSIYAAVGAEFPVLISFMLENYGIGLNVKDVHGDTQLSRAAREGWEDMVEFLLRRNDVHINSRNNYGATPSANASKNGHKSIVDLLRKHRFEGLNPNNRIML